MTSRMNFLDRPKLQGLAEDKNSPNDDLCLKRGRKLCKKETMQFLIPPFPLMFSKAFLFQTFKTWDGEGITTPIKMSFEKWCGKR